MHTEPLNLDIGTALKDGVLSPAKSLRNLFIAFVVIATVVFTYSAATTSQPEVVWGTFFVNVLFWMGLACGGCMTSVIFQIVRAKWCPPIRRLGEANVAFLPWAFFLFLISYFGKEHIFAWGDGNFWGTFGRDSWMAPDYVYARFAILLFILFVCFWKFIRMSLRVDIGYAREQSPNDERWKGTTFKSIVANWKGYDSEVQQVNSAMSYFAPVVVLLYVSVFTLLATEMIGGVEGVWYSNMLGGFIFLGNIYIAWCTMALLAVLLRGNYPAFDRVLSSRQLWDLGMLMFGFCMLWGYTFFSQFLPQWYANLPEVTGWLYLRTREFPWKGLSWLVFSMCFVIPFILLLSEDLKRVPKALASVCVLILVGVWLERYVLIVPDLSKSVIPLSFFDLVVSLGFLGAYGLSIQSFLAKFPFLPLGSPLTRGSTEW